MKVPKEPFFDFIKKLCYNNYMIKRKVVLFMLCKKCIANNGDKLSNSNYCVLKQCIVPELIQENWGYKHKKHPADEDIAGIVTNDDPLLN